MRIKSEPSLDINPSQGKVWKSIIGNVDVLGATTEFVSVADFPRESFYKHPWSIGGGGATELKELLDEQVEAKLGSVVNAIGITSVTGEDDLYILDNQATIARLGIEDSRPLLIGDEIRNWSCDASNPAIWLYDYDFNLKALSEVPN